MKVYLSGHCWLEHDPLFEAHFMEAQEEMELMGYEVINHTLYDFGQLTWVEQLVRRIILLETCDAIFLIGHKGEWKQSVDATIEFFIARNLGLDVLSQEDRPRNIGGSHESD